MYKYTLPDWWELSSGRPRIYDKCTPDQLQAFCKARKIRTPYVGHLSLSLQHQTLAKALAEDDGIPHFDKFLDLPPEMRVMIYTMHLQDINPHNIFPSQPPITKVTKQICQESLPVFHDVCNFRITITQKYTAGGLESLVFLKPFHIDRFNSTTEPHAALALSRLTHLQIYGFMDDVPREDVWTSWQFTITSGDEKSAIRVKVKCIKDLDDVAEELQPMFEARAAALQAELQARGSQKLTLQAGDGDILLNLFRTTDG